ncbi:MAG: TIGR01458 family HAD-type hydrolase [Pseudomonadota bacterium]
MDDMTSGVLLDISGVLYEGDHVISGAPEAVACLRARNIPVRFLTNTTRRPKRVIVDRLNGFGFAAGSSEVMTPAQAACDWLTRNGYTPHLLVHPDLEEDFKALKQGNPVAVVVGDAGTSFDYQKLNAAFRHLVNGAPFLALASNRVFRDADGQLSLDAGAFVHGLEYAADVAATVLGKPSGAFFQAGASSMGCPLSDVVMIGDDAENDVAGALNAGVGRAILVRTGKYRPGDATRYDTAPSLVAASISEAVATVLSL